MKTLYIIALILLVIGGLNWLFVALGFNLVTIIFGAIPALVTIVYVLVGLSAIYVAIVALNKKN